MLVGGKENSFIAENTFVCLGEIIELPHYGEMEQFYVSLVEGDHGAFCGEQASQDHCDKSLTEDFASLNISNENEIFSNVSGNRAFNAVDLHDSAINNECKGSINTSNISTYYSFCDESIYNDNQECPTTDKSNVMSTSTPVKAGKKLMNDLHEISCCLCSLATVTYYITAAATKVTIDQLGDSKRRPQHIIKEKLTYDSVGGLSQQIETLKEMVELSIRTPNVFQSYGKYLLT